MLRESRGSLVSGRAWCMTSNFKYSMGCPGNLTKDTWELREREHWDSYKLKRMLENETGALTIREARRVVR